MPSAIWQAIFLFFFCFLFVLSVQNVYAVVRNSGEKTKQSRHSHDSTRKIKLIFWFCSGRHVFTKGGGALAGGLVLDWIAKWKCQLNDSRAVNCVFCSIKWEKNCQRALKYVLYTRKSKRHSALKTLHNQIYLQSIPSSFVCGEIRNLKISLHKMEINALQKH